MRQHSSYLDMFGINGALTNHRFDPCPVSGRCAVCGVAPHIHPIGPTRSSAPQPAKGATDDGR